MSKYGYDKSVLKDVSIMPFLSQVDERTKRIMEAPDTEPDFPYNVNRLAAALHPDVQYAVVSRIKDIGGSKIITFSPDAERGTHSFAFFRAGQYLSIAVKVEGKIIKKAYTIASGPKDALGTENTSYTIVVKKNNPGYVSAVITNEWKQGTKVELSAPLGNFHYTPIRDERHVIAAAGGSGITPFLSMAYAIADGLEDFQLTILYGNRHKSNIPLRDELEAVAARSSGKVKVIHVISDEETETGNGFEQGFITAPLISKYAGKEKYSLFICGSGNMYRDMHSEVKKLGLSRKHAKFELKGEIQDPSGLRGTVTEISERSAVAGIQRALVRESLFPENQNALFSVTVRLGANVQIISCSPQISLLKAMEQAGLRAPAHCRCGECGWCHSKLVSGKIFVPESHDGRRAADREFGYIHPCISFPLSDLVIDVPEQKY